MSRFLGVKIRPDIPDPYTTLARLGGAVIEGLALNAAIVPDVADARFEADPFDAGIVAEWTLPSIGYASLLLGILEPNPDYEFSWSEELVLVLQGFVDDFSEHDRHE